MIAGSGFELLLQKRGLRAPDGACGQQLCNQTGTTEVVNTGIYVLALAVVRQASTGPLVAPLFKVDCFSLRLRCGGAAPSHELGVGLGICL